MNYYKQGDAANAEQIRAAFKAKGISDGGNSFIHEEYLYFSEGGEVDFCGIGGHIANIIKTHPDYQELELPVESNTNYDIANFKAGMAVLVRDGNEDKWTYLLFSDIDNDIEDKFIAGASAWKQCIPFEGNEYLLGTTDMPNEEYINW